MKKEIKSGIIMAISFGLTLGLIGITYAAYVNISEVNTTGTLTADLMNNVINNQKDLDSRIGGSSVPTGAVMAFFGTSCPTGWNEADGSGNEKNTLGVEGSLDLRGTFVRGMNGNVNSRDVVRVLGNYQADELKSHNHTLLIRQYDGPADQGLTRSNYAGTPTNVNTDLTGGTETRPKNVALLYCIKD